jgi:hypothetical protein
MSAQLFSFLFFGVLFVIIYLFYKNDDRKLILMISGLLFLVPFSFDYITFNHDNTMPLWLVAILLIIVMRFYRGKFRYYLIPVIIYFLILPTTTRSVTIINNLDKPVHKSIFISRFDFTYKSGERVILPIPSGSANTIINNTGYTLYVETVHYSTGLENNGSNNQLIKEIDPYSSNQLNYKIDYYFQEPPSTIHISRKQGETMPTSETNYWLHD